MSVRIRRSARALALASLALFVSCAGIGGAAPEPDTFSPPRPRSATRPALVGATVDRPVAVDLEVDVDSAGIPDVATLKLSGSGAEANRSVITEWLRSTVFEPARRNGIAMRGTFKMAADATVSVAR